MLNLKLAFRTLFRTPFVTIVVRIHSFSTADGAMQLMRNAPSRFVLLSFDTFDALAGDERTPLDVVPTIQQLVRLVVGR